jgi:pectate lyase
VEFYSYLYYVINQTNKDMIKVYHNPNFHGCRMNVTQENADIILKNDTLTLVAEVETDSLEDAYQLTNNIENSWVENEKVTAKVDRGRSTSMGDVLEQDGKYHMVAGFGFAEITVTPEKFKR